MSGSIFNLNTSETSETSDISQEFIEDIMLHNSDEIYEAVELMKITTGTYHFNHSTFVFNLKDEITLTESMRLKPNEFIVVPSGIYHIEGESDVLVVEFGNIPRKKIKGYFRAVDWRKMDSVDDAIWMSPMHSVVKKLVPMEVYLIAGSKSISELFSLGYTIECPPGIQIALTHTRENEEIARHQRENSMEKCIILKGTYAFSIEDKRLTSVRAQSSPTNCILSEGDVIAIDKGCMRSFAQVSKDCGLILSVITGGDGIDDLMFDSESLGMLMGSTHWWKKWTIKLAMKCGLRFNQKNNLI